MTSHKTEGGGFRKINQALLICSIFLILLSIAFYKEINAWLLTILNIFSPVILGLILAYLLNPIFRFFERRVFYRLYPSAARRAISLLLTYIVALLLIGLIVLLILPQLISTLMTFITNYQSYFDGAIASINGVIRGLNNWISNFFNTGDLIGYVDTALAMEVLGKVFEELTTFIPTLTVKAGSLVSGAADVIFAIFISVYLLSSKEKRYSQVMKMRNALFSDKTNQAITKICTTANNLFGKFAEGRLLDSLIVGLLTYISLALFQIPYPLLIAAFIAIWNIIPNIGLLIGYVPIAIILFLTEAHMLLPFTLIMFAIYQVDSNIISPRILGYNTGVSPLCVIIAICTMGSAFGLVGLIISVPLFATLLDLADHHTHNRLQHKRMPDDVENYYAPDSPVDYLHMSKSSLGRFLLRMEKNALRIKQMIENGQERQLSRKDRRILYTYHWARKLNLLSETPPEVLIQFNAEMAERKAKEECDKIFEEKRAAALSVANLEQEMGGAEA